VTDDRILAEFVEFGESSLDLRITFLVNSSNWEDLETIKTDVNFKLMKIIADHGASVAFPTRTIYLENSQPTAVAGREQMSRALSDDGEDR
jgi:MscS family membrane protein